MKREKTNELLIHLRNVENTSLDLFQHYLQTQYGDYLYLCTDINNNNNNNNNNINFNHNPKYVQDIVQNEKITLASGLDQQIYVVYVKSVVYFNSNSSPPNSKSNCDSLSNSNSNCNSSFPTSLYPLANSSPISSSPFSTSNPSYILPPHSYNPPSPSFNPPSPHNLEVSPYSSKEYPSTNTNINSNSNSNSPISSFTGPINYVSSSGSGSGYWSGNGNGGSRGRSGNVNVNSTGNNNNIHPTHQQIHGHPALHHQQYQNQIQNQIHPVHPYVVPHEGIQQSVPQSYARNHPLIHQPPTHHPLIQSFQPILPFQPQYQPQPPSPSQQTLQHAHIPSPSSSYSPNSAHIPSPSSSYSPKSDKNINFNSNVLHNNYNNINNNPNNSSNQLQQLSNINQNNGNNSNKNDHNNYQFQTKRGERSKSIPSINFVSNYNLISSSPTSKSPIDYDNNIYNIDKKYASLTSPGEYELIGSPLPLPPDLKLPITPLNLPQIPFHPSPLPSTPPLPINPSSDSPHPSPLPLPLPSHLSLHPPLLRSTSFFEGHFLLFIKMFIII